MSKLKKTTTIKMIDHLQNSIMDLGPQELCRFKRELKVRLPDVFERAAQAARREPKPKREDIEHV